MKKGNVKLPLIVLFETRNITFYLSEQSSNHSLIFNDLSKLLFILLCFILWDLKLGYFENSVITSVCIFDQIHGRNKSKIQD